jgi:hypothetical protein
MASNSRIELRRFDVLQKQRRNAFAKTLQILVFDASHQQIGLAID